MTVHRFRPGRNCAEKRRYRALSALMARRAARLNFTDAPGQQAGIAQQAEGACAQGQQAVPKQAAEGLVGQERYSSPLWRATTTPLTTPA